MHPAVGGNVTRTRGGRGPADHARVLCRTDRKPTLFLCTLFGDAVYGPHVELFLLTCTSSVFSSTVKVRNLTYSAHRATSRTKLWRRGYGDSSPSFAARGSCRAVEVTSRKRSSAKPSPPGEASSSSIRAKDTEVVSYPANKAVIICETVYEDGMQNDGPWSVNLIYRQHFTITVA